MWLITVALAVGHPGWSGTAEASEIAAGGAGVVVEEVGERSTLEKAGLRPGDVVLAWERLPNPPANPEGLQGAIESVFDWIWLEVEQAPRGTVKLTGQRGGEIKVFEVVPGEWKATLRPRMTEEMLENYVRGKELIETEEFEAGVILWHRVVDVAKNQAAEDGSLRCWFLLRIGDAWGKARQWEKAHGAYRSALEAAHDPLARVAIWQTIGDAHEKASEFEPARKAYGSAQEIRERTWGENLAFATSLNDLGRLDSKQGRLDAAQSYLQRALEIRQELAPGSFDVASSLNSLGIAASSRGDLDRAAEYHEGALEIRQKLAPGSLDMAVSLNNLGALTRNRGDLDRAVEYYERSLEIFKKGAPDSLYLAASLNNLGRVASDRGHLDLAAEYYQRSVRIKQKVAPDSLYLASSLHNLGVLAFDRGDLDRAAEYYERSLEIRQKLARGSLDMALSLNNLGLLAFDRGDLDRAARYYEKSLEIKQKLAPGSLDMATSLNNLGNLASARGDLDLAAEYYDKSLEIRQRLARGSLDMIWSLNNLGTLAFARGDLDLAIEYYKRSLEISQKLAPGRSDVAASLGNLGILASARGDLDRAAEYFEQSLEIQRKLAPGSSVEALILHDLAGLRRKQNQPQEALALFLQALQALENQIGRLGGSRNVRAGFRADRAAYYRNTIDLSLELQQPEEAFHTLERSRAQSFLAQLAERDLVFSDVPEELERQRRRIARNYDETQDEIAQLNPEEKAEEIEAVLSRLRQLRWDYGDITEKIIKASPKLGALRYPKPLDLDAARQALDPGTVMLSYSVGEKSTKLFVLATEGSTLSPLDSSKETALRVETIAIGEKELRSQIQRWNESIYTAQAGDESGALHSVRFLGKRLYAQLIEPVADAVAGSERLLIIPDGPLHVLPWAALIREIETPDETGRNWQYLAEWKPLHTVLSATVYGELKQSRRPLPTSEEEPAPIRLAAFGDPLYPGNGSGYGDFRVRSATDRGLFDDWTSLPYTRQEVEQIAALYPPEMTRIYLGADATEEAVKAVGHRAHSAPLRAPREAIDILHLATHGHLDDRFPFDSAVVLTIPGDSDNGRDNGLLQVWEIFERVRLEADLVVLSACASGVGKEQGGEGLIGLTRAFQHAGARSVVASLWNVRDRATAELMVRFYKYLNEGLTKDEALRAAQLELIRGVAAEDGAVGAKAPDYSAPYYWAPFQIYGDWQ